MVDHVRRWPSNGTPGGTAREVARTTRATPSMAITLPAACIGLGRSPRMIQAAVRPLTGTSTANGATTVDS
jgi:hypothetical protein